MGFIRSFLNSILGVENPVVLFFVATARLIWKRIIVPVVPWFLVVLGILTLTKSWWWRWYFPFEFWGETAAIIILTAYPVLLLVRPIWSALKSTWEEIRLEMKKVRPPRLAEPRVVTKAVQPQPVPQGRP